MIKSPVSRFFFYERRTSNWQIAQWAVRVSGQLKHMVNSADGMSCFIDVRSLKCCWLVILDVVGFGWTGGDCLPAKDSPHIT
jgi:hypothetical protein